MAVTLDGESFDFTDFIADNGYGHLATRAADGAIPAEALFPNRIFRRLLNELNSRAAAIGGAVAAIALAWDTGTTDADPGTGEVRVNNATLSSATAMYISTTDTNGADVSAVIALFDDSTSTVKGVLRIGHRTDETKWALYTVSGSVTTATGYRKVTLTYVAGSGTFSAADPVAIGFVRTGDKGDTGATGGVASFNGRTGTVTPQAGDYTASDVSAVGQGLHTLWIPAAAMVARTTNGAATGSVETTTNKVMLKTLDFDASTSEYAQFFIRMPKSWDEGTVTAAFTWSHAATATNFGVVFGLQGVALSNDDAADTAFGTAQTSSDTGGTTNDIYISPTTSAITIAGSPAAEDWVAFQVYRAVSDGSDTMAVDARLHGVTLYYTVNAATDA